MAEYRYGNVSVEWPYSVPIGGVIAAIKKSAAARPEPKPGDHGLGGPEDDDDNDHDHDHGYGYGLACQVDD